MELVEEGGLAHCVAIIIREQNALIFFFKIELGARRERCGREWLLADKFNWRGRHCTAEQQCTKYGIRVCVLPGAVLLRTADPYRVLAPWAQSTKITIRVRI